VTTEPKSSATAPSSHRSTSRGSSDSSSANSPAKSRQASRFRREILIDRKEQLEAFARPQRFIDDPTS